MTPELAKEVQSFCARVLHLCHYVQDANGLTDLSVLKEAAKALEKEADGISRVFHP